jgi:hypothetical protein
MQGDERDASALRRMAMRTTSRNEQVAGRGLNGLPVLSLRFGAAGLRLTTLEHESCCATQTNRPALGACRRCPMGDQVQACLT